MCLAKEKKSDSVDLREEVKCLKELLSKQISEIKQGSFTKLEVYRKQAEKVVERIASDRNFNTREYEKEKEALVELYGQLSLAVNDCKQQMGEEIKSCRKNKNAVSVYRENI